MMKVARGTQRAANKQQVTGGGRERREGTRIAASEAGLHRCLVPRWYRHRHRQAVVTRCGFG